MIFPPFPFHHALCSNGRGIVSKAYSKLLQYRWREFYSVGKWRADVSSSEWQFIQPRNCTNTLVFFSWILLQHEWVLFIFSMELRTRSLLLKNGFYGEHGWNNFVVILSEFTLKVLNLKKYWFSMSLRITLEVIVNCSF